MKFKWQYLVVFVLVIMSVLACGMPMNIIVYMPAQPTAAAQTPDAARTAIKALETLLTPSTATATVLPTTTPSPTSTLTAIPTSTQTPSATNTIIPTAVIQYYYYNYPYYYGQQVQPQQWNQWQQWQGGPYSWWPGYYRTPRPRPYYRPTRTPTIPPSR